MQGKMNVELLVSLVSEHKELYDKRDSDYKNLDKRELVFLVFLFYIKRHLMSGNEFACSLGSSSAKIAWVWTQKTRWKTLANNARRYSSRCVRPLRALHELAVPSAGQFKAFKWFKAPNANRIRAEMCYLTQWLFMNGGENLRLLVLS